MIRALVLPAVAAGFAGLAGWLGWVAVELLAPPSPPPQAPAAATPEPPGPPPPLFAAKPLDDFEDILDRPLFQPDRQPPYVYEEEEPEEMEVEDDPLPSIMEEDEPLDALLRGVVTTSSGGFILLEPWEGGMKRLSLGEAHEGWVLIALDGRSAVFERGEDQVTLSLSYRGDE